MNCSGTIVELAKRYEGPFVSAANSWSREQQGGALCRSCIRLNRLIFPQPLDVVLMQLPDRISYSNVFYGGVGVIHVALLDAIKSHLVDFAIGRCYSAKGQEYSDYRSIYSRNVLPLRIAPLGRPEMRRCIRCSECGIWSVSAEYLYVVRREFCGCEVIQDSISRIYLSSTLAERIDWDRFSDLVPRRIPVYEQRLGGDPCPEHIWEHQ